MRTTSLAPAATSATAAVALPELCATCGGFPVGHSECLGVPFGQRFPSVPHTWWFVVVAVTTVGFGDVVPESGAGKLFVAVLLGVGLRGSYSACILMFACIQCTD